MTDGLQYTQRALELWRSVRGNESTYMQCQRYDGFYWQWVYLGTEAGIETYSSARRAALASAISL